MSARVSVSIADEPAAAVAVKSATTPAEIDRLAAEAERLRQITHPGVVGYVVHREHGERAELCTVYAGESLERWRGTVEQIAGLTAALATTLGELHEAGVVHGRVDRSHVLRGPGGRPVLCGLSPPPDEAEPATDVAAIGHLLVELLADGARAGGRYDRWRDLFGPGPARRALSQVAGHATDPFVARRPTARRLARAVLEAAPGAALPESPPAPGAGSTAPAGSTGRTDEARPGTSPETDVPAEVEANLFEQAFVDQRDTGEEEIFVDRPWLDTGPNATVPDRPRPSGRPRRWAPAAIVGLVGLAALTTGWVTRAGVPADGPASGEGPTSTTSDGRPGCGRPAPGDGHARSHEKSARTADVNGDGCPQTVVITSDGVIEVDEQRWAVGEPGDSMTLGDWDCDGSATPAVFRPSTGDVFVFEAWADRGQPLRVRPVAQLPDGVAFVDADAVRTGTDAPTCGTPVVELSSGATQAVEVSQ